MAGFGKLKARKFAFRIQSFSASSTKPRRVKLIAQRRIFVKGKQVVAGTDVAQNGIKPLLSKPALKGSKVRNGS